MHLWRANSRAGRFLPLIYEFATHREIYFGGFSSSRITSARQQHCRGDLQIRVEVRAALAIRQGQPARATSILKECRTFLLRRRRWRQLSRCLSRSPPRRARRRTGDEMLRADSGSIAMKLQRPSPPSSRGPARRAHPKPTSWRRRVASMSSMGLFAPIGEVDMKSAPGPVRASRTDRRSDRSRP
jgi:hypothetical protein